MPSYVVDGKTYFIKEDLTQQEAEEFVKRRFGSPGDQAESNPPRSDYMNPEDEGTLQEIGEGVASGLLAIPQGITETITSLIDLGAGTNYTDAVVKGFNKMRNDLGIDPAGAAGKITEGLIQFGVPGLGAAAAVSKFSKLGKLARGTRGMKPDAGSLKTMKITKQPLDMKDLTRSQKLGLAAQQIVAAGAADAVVATDGTQSLGDFFEGGYGPFFQTEDLLGLEGRERAAARIYNKVIAHGLSGSILAGALPPVIGAGLSTSAKIGARAGREVGLAVPGAAIGAGAATVDELAQGKDIEDIDFGKVATGAAYGAGIGAGAGVSSRVLRAGSKKAAEAIAKQEERFLKGESSDPGIMNTLDRAVARALSAFRYRSFLPGDVARVKSLVNPAIEGDIKKAEKALKEVDRQIAEVLSPSNKEFAEYRRLPEFTKQKLINNFMDVLEGAAEKDLEIPKILFDKFLRAKNIIDDLSSRVIDTGAAKSLPEVATSGLMSRNAFIKQVQNNIENGGYLARQYQLFNDDNFKLAPDMREALIDQIVDGKAVDIKHVQKFLKDEPGTFRISDEFVDTFRSLQREGPEGVGQFALTRLQAERYIDNVTKYYKSLKHSSGGTAYSARTVPVVRLNPAVLNKSKVDNEIIRAILGEVRNPKEAYMHTVGELSNFIAADAFYSSFKKTADNIIRNTDPRADKPLFINTNDLVREKIVQINQTRPPNAQITSLRELPSQERDAVLKDIMESVQRRGGRGLEYIVLGRDSVSGFDPEGLAARSVFGEMYGYAIPKPMYEAMSNVINERTSVMGDIARGLYYPMVKLKGLSQYAKTILSPITQVRNVTSASLFALAQGNVGKNASLFESVDLVLRDLIDKELKLKGTGKVSKATSDRFDFSLNDEVLDFLVDLQNRGVIGSSAQLREIQANLRQGLGYRGTGITGLPAQRTGVADDVGVSDFEVALRSRPQAVEDSLARQQSRIETPPDGKGLQGMSKTALKGSMNMTRRFLDTAEGLYKGGDDIWKIYNYAFELQKLRNSIAKIGADFADNPTLRRQQLSAFARHIGKQKGEGLDEALKRAAADTVRNTVPNYELVPEFIKGLRGVPLGNFIAFPAEILRTGFNTLDTAAKELESPVQAIREIGMKRLMGGITAFGLVGEGLQRFAQNLTDTSDEELQSINRLAASWQRNSQLIPVGKDDNGNPEFIDFSHTNPYDLLSRGFRTILNTYRETEKQSVPLGEQVRKIGFETLSEYFTPFIDYSMVFSALQDVAPTAGGGRGGRTRSGAKVYREQDSGMVAFEKSMLHMFNTLIPGMIPVRIPVGAELGIAGGNFPEGVKSIEKSRFLRGVFSPEGEMEPTTGKTYKQGAELFRAFTGLNTQTLDLKRLGEFRAQEFKQDRSGTAALFNEVLRLQDASPEQIITAFRRADDARLKVFRKYASTIDDLKTLGLTRPQIRKIMKDAQLGEEETSSLLNDRYVPFKPSKEKIKDARKKNIYVPTGDINALRSLRRGMSLRKEVDSDELSIPNLFGLGNQRAVNPELPPKVNTAPPPNINTTSSINPIQMTNVGSSPLTRTNPSFLGSSPDDILKNLDIARRTG
tara:strand:+ start:389 stop:5137 length:4749 start_codon:yes stop_codon:yes gene_type:complete